MYKIHDKVYDLTEFVKIHPGGQDMFQHLEPYTNITPMIYSYHKNPKTIFTMLPKYEVPSTNDTVIKYDTDYVYDRYCELKKLVYAEIHEKKIPLHWSSQEIAYNGFMFSVYLGMWAYCFYYSADVSHWWMALLAISTVGFTILVYHETSHYTGFKNQKYNLAISNYYPFATMNHWKYHHNYLHHSFTDTEYDQDCTITLLNVNIFKFWDKPDIQYIYKFQYIYQYILWLVAGVVSQKNCYFSMLNSNKFIVFCIYYFLGLYKTLLFFSILGFNFTFVISESYSI